MKRYTCTCFGKDAGLWLGLFLLPLIPVFLAGCRSDVQQVSRETDRKVYDLIAQTWDDSLGSPGDYQLQPLSFEKRDEALQDIYQSELLTLLRAVQLAMDNSQAFQEARETLYLKALDLTEAQHLYELTPFAGGIGGYAKEGDREAAGGQGTLGVQKLLATGATVSSGFTAGYLDVLTGDFRSGLSTIFYAAVTQPLLRGADRKAVLETLTQAQQDMLYAVRDFNRFRQVFLVSVVSDYYRLLQQYDQYRSLQADYIQLLALTDNMRDLAAAGRLPRYALEQAEQDKLLAMDQSRQAETSYKQQLDAFKLKLGIPPQQTILLDQNEWQVLMDAELTPADGSEDQALQAALDQRLDLANASDQVLDAERHAEIAADALKPGLDLVGLFSPANDNRRRYLFGADPGDLNRIRDRYELSLRMDLPMDRTVEANDYKRALIQCMRRQRRHMQVTDQVRYEVRKAYRDMETAQAHYANQKAARDLAVKRLENTFLLLRYGRANTRDVLDAQKDSFRAREEYARAVTDYSIAKLNLYRDCGVLWIKANGRLETRTAVKR